MTQIPFDFDHLPALGGEDFLVAPSNSEAVQWVERWPRWPQAVLVICGPQGSGKTHLAHVFQALSGAALVSPKSLKVDGADGALGKHPALVVEDAEAFLTAGLEEELLHLYNLAVEVDTKILMTAVQAPARWDVQLKDLSSRLNTAQVSEIKPPDDALLAALIVKQFADRQMTVDQDVLSYMLTRTERTFAGVRALINAIDALSLAEKRAITKPLVRRVLDALDAPDA